MRVGAPLLAVAACAAAGCGGSAVAERAPRTATTRAGTPHAAAIAPATHRQSVAARVDAASDAVLAEGKIHIAEGAPSDAQIRREIKTLRKAGVVLPSGDTVESFERGPTYTGAGALQIETPETAWNPRLNIYSIAHMSMYSQGENGEDETVSGAVFLPKDRC